MKGEARNTLMFQAGSLVGIKVRQQTHTQLVDDALDAFTKAEQKIVSAIGTIQEQINTEQEVIKAAEKRADEAGVSKDKLSRVLDRLKSLTA